MHSCAQAAPLSCNRDYQPREDWHVRLRQSHNHIRQAKERRLAPCTLPARVQSGDGSHYFQCGWSAGGPYKPDGNGGRIRMALARTPVCGPPTSSWPSTSELPPPSGSPSPRTSNKASTIQTRPQSQPTLAACPARGQTWLRTCSTERYRALHITLPPD